MPLEQIQDQFAAEARIRQRWIGFVKLTIVVGVSYLVAARLSVVLLSKDNAALFWPAAGISAGTLIALGRNARWPVALGTIAATIVADVMGGRNVWTSGIFGLCNAGEALLIAWLIEHYFGRHFSFGRLGHVLGFLAATIVGTAVSGVGDTVGKLINNPDQPGWITWKHWFTADLIGVIVVAPFIVGLFTAARVPPPRRELTEGAVTLGAIVVATGTIILWLPGTWWDIDVLVVLLLPLLLWAAARCRPVFSSAAAFAVCMMVGLALAFDIGHFNRSGEPINELALSAHVSIVGVALCALILSSLFAERAESARRLQEALSVGSVLAFDWDVNTDVSLRSDNVAQILGLEQQEISTGASFVARINPQDQARYRALLNGLRRDNPSYSTTYRFARPDGREIWLQDRARAEFDATGCLVRLTGLRVDITERMQAETRQTALVAELDHRVKNVLARVIAIMNETRERSNSMGDFVKTVDGRIQSMAAAHSLLSQQRWHDVGIADLVSDQLAPYATGANVTLHGPNIMLTAATTQALAIVIHELVTNAVKFGALSTPAGRVSVSWGAPSGHDGPAAFTVEWREIGGPSVTKPIQSGFGTSLIRELIPHELGGTVDLAFDPDGVCCRIRAPLESAQSAASLFAAMPSAQPLRKS